MEFRRATPHDFSAIHALQSAHLMNALAAEDRQGGFLSAEFTRRQIAKMASDIGIIWPSILFELLKANEASKGT